MLSKGATFKSIHLKIVLMDCEGHKACLCSFRGRHCRRRNFYVQICTADNIKAGNNHHDVAY